MAIPQALEAIIQQLAALPHVERVILFGSRARGDHDERADIDLAVACPNASESQWSDIWHLTDQAPTLLEIDLVRLEGAQPKLLENVQNEGVVLYERP
ncbi:MAG: nucleotidyltransferase domain-containing protein [Magnetococcales bacterium]|nr:nucleotidyltransferase domain-containing protein [Magnetococcales bacterium]